MLGTGAGPATLGRKKEEQAAVYANRRRIRGERGKSLLRQRGEKLERSFAHLYETGGMRRVHLRRHPNLLKRLLVHVAAFNLGLVMRQLLGRGTPRGLQGCNLDLLGAWLGVLSEAWARKLASQGPAEGFEPQPGFFRCHKLLSSYYREKPRFYHRAARGPHRAVTQSKIRCADDYTSAQLRLNNLPMRQALSGCGMINTQPSLRLRMSHGLWAIGGRFDSQEAQKFEY